MANGAERRLCLLHARPIGEMEAKITPTDTVRRNFPSLLAAVTGLLVSWGIHTLFPAIPQDRPAEHDTPERIHTFLPITRAYVWSLRDWLKQNSHTRRCGYFTI